MHLFLSFHWPRAHYLTCKYLLANDGLPMRGTIQINNIPLMRNCNHALGWENGRTLWSESSDWMVKQLLNSVIARQNEVQGLLVIAVIITLNSVISQINCCSPLTNHNIFSISCVLTPKVAEGGWTSLVIKSSLSQIFCCRMHNFFQYS